MTDSDWEVKRSLRLELLRVSDSIEELSIRFRDKGLDSQHATDLNNLQIKVIELIGRLMVIKTGDV